MPTSLVRLALIVSILTTVGCLGAGPRSGDRDDRAPSSGRSADPGSGDPLSIRVPFRFGADGWSGPAALVVAGAGFRIAELVSDAPVDLWVEEAPGRLRLAYPWSWAMAGREAEVLLSGSLVLRAKRISGSEDSAEVRIEGRVLPSQPAR